MRIGDEDGGGAERTGIGVAVGGNGEPDPLIQAAGNGRGIFEKPLRIFLERGGM